VTFSTPANDPPGKDPGDLRYFNGSMFASQEDRIPLIHKARIVAGCRSLFALNIFNPFDNAGHRRTINMNVDRREENTYCRGAIVMTVDARHFAVSSRYNDPCFIGHLAVRVTKKERHKTGKCCKQ